MAEQPFLIAESLWVPVRDGNPSAFSLFKRHYSCRRSRKLQQFVGPGEKLVLLTADARAVFAWRKFKNDDGQRGVNCAIFHNEGAGVASDLIRLADEIAWERWPGERLYTYVNAGKIRPTRQPGRCFLKAGWRYVRRENGKPARTKRRGLFILEMLPEWASNQVEK